MATLVKWLYVYDLCNKTSDNLFREKLGLKCPIKFRYSVEAYWVKDADTVYSEEYYDKKSQQNKTRTAKRQYQLSYGYSRQEL